MFTFEMDKSTGAAVDKLKPVYGVRSKADVLKRAVALAVLAAKYADKDGNLHVRAPNGRVVEIRLAR